MSRFLIVAATQAEVQPIIDHFSITVNENTGLFVNEVSPGAVSLLITSVGMVNTAYYMGRCAEKDFDHVINMGVCGAFDRSLEIGEVVNVVQDSLSEMGAQDDEDFVMYPQMNLGGTNLYESKTNFEYLPLQQLKKVKGITVNTVHGQEASIEKVKKIYSPGVESMEGAAFLRGCETYSNYYQLRAVSNYVEKRDKSKWNLPLAIGAINKFVIQLTSDLNK